MVDGLPRRGQASGRRPIPRRRGALPGPAQTPDWVRDQGSGFKMQDLGFRIQDSGFRIQDSSRVGTKNLGIRV
jgi:hypothetical protein